VQQRHNALLLAAEEKCAEKNCEENAFKDTWVQCDDCNKWRKLLCNPAALPDSWSCRLNPNPAFTLCETAEEHWSDSDEDQEEELAPRHAKRKRGGPSYDRWDMITGRGAQSILRGFCRDLRRNDKHLALTTSPPAATHGAMREYLRMYY
jgi:hypothetical protein